MGDGCGVCAMGLVVTCGLSVYCAVVVVYCAVVVGCLPIYKK